MFHRQVNGYKVCQASQVQEGLAVSKVKRNHFEFRQLLKLLNFYLLHYLVNVCQFSVPCHTFNNYTKSATYIVVVKRKNDLIFLGRCYD